MHDVRNLVEDLCLIIGRDVCPTQIVVSFVCRDINSIHYAFAYLTEILCMVGGKKVLHVLPKLRIFCVEILV